MPHINDRVLVFLAFLTTLVLMGILVASKGCTGTEPVMLALGTIATTLAGVLGGISRSSPGATTTTTTSDDKPPVTDTQTKTQ